MISFRVRGPFQIPVANGVNGRVIDSKKIDDRFWRGYSNRRGVYIFALKHYNKYKPYYVGKAGDQPFQTEVFADHKIARHYCPTLAQYAGHPYLFLVIPDKGKGPWPVTAISRLEERLIAMAATVNTNISNKRLLPKETGRIIGFDMVSQGKPNNASVSFGNLMNP